MISRAGGLVSPSKPKRKTKPNGIHSFQSVESFQSVKSILPQTPQATPISARSIRAAEPGRTPHQ